MIGNSIRQITLQTITVTIDDQTSEIFKNVAETVDKNGKLHMIVLDRGIREVVVPQYRDIEKVDQNGYVWVAGDRWNAR